MANTEHLSHVLAATLIAGAVGCQTANFQAASLPQEYRAASRIGRDRVRLGGMLASETPSSAIGQSDLLELSIATGYADEEPTPQQVRVAADGTIDVPLVGRVVVGGLEPWQAAQQIVSASVTRGIYRNPQVSVKVEEQATNEITVLGAVDEPGVKQLPRGGCDVLTAIAAAGGFSEEAGVTVEVLRAGSAGIARATPPQLDGESGVQQVAFDAPPAASPRAEVLDLADPDKISPGKLRLSDRDVVVVRPEEKRVIHVTGLVHTPDQFELLAEHDFRVLDAVAMAGGITTPIADKVLIVRQVEGQPAPLLIEASLSDAKQNGAENLVLQAGDLVSVESTAATVALSTLENFFRITLGVGGNLRLF